MRLQALAQKFQVVSGWLHWKFQFWMYIKIEKQQLMKQDFDFSCSVFRGMTT